MTWARIKCWFVGHDIIKIKYAVKTTKEYHGHDEVRKYTGCSKCGAGSPQKELNWWGGGDKSVFERHEALFSLLLFLLALVAVIFVVTVLVMATQRYSCRINSEIMELAWKFNWITGNCYFEVEGRWIARNLLTVVDILR